MRIVVDSTKSVVNSVLVYRMQEFAFGAEPRPEHADSSVSLNEVQVMVSTEDNQLLFVTGYCPYQSWHQSPLRVPTFIRRALVITDVELQPGVSIQLNRGDERWRVQVDTRSGWVCLGNAELESLGVEFAPGCVAMLLDGQLIALWLRPKEIPKAVIMHLPS
jgi:hypothetical protein